MMMFSKDCLEKMWGKAWSVYPYNSRPSNDKR